MLDHFIRKIKSKIHRNETIWYSSSYIGNINGSGNGSDNQQYHSNLHKTYRNRPSNSISNKLSNNSRFILVLGRLYVWYRTWCYKKKDHGQERFVSLEYRQKYHEKLKELIQLVEDNKKNTLSKSPFESLLRLPFEKKRLILQHFYIDENHFHPHYKLYSNYKKYVGYYNAIRLDILDLAKDINELHDFLSKTTSKYKKSKTWFKGKEIADVLHISPNLLTSDFAHYSEPEFFEKIPNGVTIQKQYKDENIIFVIGEVVIGGTDSENDFYKIYPKLEQRLDRIAKSSDEIRIAFQTVDTAFSHMLSKFYDIAIEPMRLGESVIGSCESCIEFFTSSEKAELEKLLTKFNSSWDNSLEQTWRNRKPIRRLFSQRFTKDHSYHFRDSL